MNRLALIGYGKMGKLLGELAPSHGFEVALRLASSDNAGGAGITAERFEGIDVAIDFSVAAAVPATAERLAGLGVPLAGRTTRLAPLSLSMAGAGESSHSGLPACANLRA